MKINKAQDRWRILHGEYCDLMISHTRLREVRDEINRVIQTRNGGLILVPGPTRVGKTTLLEGVIQQVLNENLAEMNEDPGFIPASYMTAFPYKRGYRWTDHYYGALEALNEPLIKQKSAGYNIAPDRAARHAPVNYRYEREDMLRRSFESAVRQRRTRIFGIDEAQSIVIGSSGDMHRANVEIIKSLANPPGPLHIMVGTYDLLDLFNLSGQIGARTGRPINFSRYNPTSSADVASFSAVVKTLASKMPVLEPPRLDANTLEYLLDKSLGLVGLLKVWFSDALADVLYNDRNSVTRCDLERHQPPEEVLEQISREIIVGEQRLHQDGSKFSLIKARMMAGAKFDEDTWQQRQGYADGSSLPASAKGTNEASRTVPDNSSGKKRVRRNTKPFERNPSRDPVGQGRKKRVA